MKIIWQNREKKFDSFIIACDVGGTKTDLGLVGEEQGHLEVICKARLPSQEMGGLDQPLGQFIEEIKTSWPDAAAEAIAISAAGPVANNSCTLTNCSFTVDGDAIADRAGLRTFVFNDFLAMSWGVLTIDVTDPESAIPLIRSGGTPPRAGDGVQLVIGPGTGLGISYIVPGDNRPLPQSSEGGHVIMTPFDGQSERLLNFLQESRGRRPTAEMCISGPGINNIYRFLRTQGEYPVTDTIRQIDGAKASNRPRLIAAHREGDPICLATMSLFAKCLGNYASNMAAVFLPFGGIYLTGGIVRKNAPFLASSPHFVHSFEAHPESHIAQLLNKISLSLITNRDISLQGAAAYARTALFQQPSTP